MSDFKKNMVQIKIDPLKESFVLLTPGGEEIKNIIEIKVTDSFDDGGYKLLEVKLHAKIKE